MLVNVNVLVEIQNLKTGYFLWPVALLLYYKDYV